MWGYEFTTKAATLHGGSAEFVPSLCVVGLGSVAARARVLVHEVFDRGTKAAFCGVAHFASQLLDCGAQTVARGVARCASQVPDRSARLLPAAPLVVPCRYLIVVPKSLPAAALVVHRRAVFIYLGAQAVARGGACCASKVLRRCAGPLPAAPRR